MARDCKHAGKYYLLLLLPGSWLPVATGSGTAGAVPWCVSQCLRHRRQGNCHVPC